MSEMRFLLDLSAARLDLSDVGTSNEQQLLFKLARPQRGDEFSLEEAARIWVQRQSEEPGGDDDVGLFRKERTRWFANLSIRPATFDRLVEAFLSGKHQFVTAELGVVGEPNMEDGQSHRVCVVHFYFNWAKD